MDCIIDASQIREVRINQSKSEAQRFLCASALYGSGSVLLENPCGDTLTTLNALRELGFQFTEENGLVTFGGFLKKDGVPLINCGDCGVALRFLLPVACVFYEKTEFVFSEQLGRRPLKPLLDCMAEHGVVSARNGNSLITEGLLRGGEFRIDGSVSSQFVSGLMFARMKTGGVIRPQGGICSAPYVKMTEYAISRADGSLMIPGGDYTNAAVFLAMGLLGDHPVSVDGLDENSLQGDRAFIGIIRSLGGKITEGNGRVTAYPSVLGEGSADVSDCPDLYPVLAALSYCYGGRISFSGTERLRFKESARTETVREMLESETADPHGDHRIVMAAAVKSVRYGPVRVRNAECVNKSYPEFLKIVNAAEI